MYKSVKSYKVTIHQLVDKINDARLIKRIYDLVSYLYLMAPDDK